MPLTLLASRASKIADRHFMRSGRRSRGAARSQRARPGFLVHDLVSFAVLPAPERHVIMETGHDGRRRMPRLRDARALERLMLPVVIS